MRGLGEVVTLRARESGLLSVVQKMLVQFAAHNIEVTWVFAAVELPYDLGVQRIPEGLLPKQEGQMDVTDLELAGGWVCSCKSVRIVCPSS